MRRVRGPAPRAPLPRGLVDNEWSPYVSIRPYRIRAGAVLAVLALLASAVWAVVPSRAADAATPVPDQPASVGVRIYDDARDLTKSVLRTGDYRIPAGRIADNIGAITEQGNPTSLPAEYRFLGSFLEHRDGSAGEERPIGYVGDVQGAAAPDYNGTYYGVDALDTQVAAKLDAADMVVLRFVKVEKRYNVFYTVDDPDGAAVDGGFIGPSTVRENGDMLVEPRTKPGYLTDVSANGVPIAAQHGVYRLSGVSGDQRIAIRIYKKATIRVNLLDDPGLRQALRGARFGVEGRRGPVDGRADATQVDFPVGDAGASFRVRFAAAERLSGGRWTLDSLRIGSEPLRVPQATTPGASQRTTLRNGTVVTITYVRAGRPGAVYDMAVEHAIDDLTISGIGFNDGKHHEVIATFDPDVFHVQTWYQQGRLFTGTRENGDQVTNWPVPVTGTYPLLPNTPIGYEINTPVGAARESDQLILGYRLRAGFDPASVTVKLNGVTVADGVPWPNQPGYTLVRINRNPAIPVQQYELSAQRIEYRVTYDIGGRTDIVVDPLRYGADSRAVALIPDIPDQLRDALTQTNRVFLGWLKIGDTALYQPGDMTDIVSSPHDANGEVRFFPWIVARPNAQAARATPVTATVSYRRHPRGGGDLTVDGAPDRQVRLYAGSQLAAFGASGLTPDGYHLRVASNLFTVDADGKQYTVDYDEDAPAARYRLRVHVASNDGAPLPGVGMRLLAENGSVFAEAVTDAQGDAEFTTAMPTGTYTVEERTTPSGYRPVPRHVLTVDDAGGTIAVPGRADQRLPQAGDVLSLTMTHERESRIEALPLTGGMGYRVPVIVAVASGLMLAAAVAGVRDRLRARRRRLR